MKLIKETSKKITKALFFPDNKKSLIPNWLSFSRLIGGITIPIIINKNAPLKDIVENNNIIRNLNDYLNNNTDLSELEEYTENDKANKDKKDNFKLETINNIIGDKMTPKNSRKMNHIF